MSLRFANLNGLNFVGPTLPTPTCQGRTSKRTDLSRSSWTRHPFGCDLAEPDLSFATVTGADLRGASLRGANLAQADLSQADFREGTIAVADRSRGLAMP